MKGKFTVSRKTVRKKRQAKLKEVHVQLAGRLFALGGCRLYPVFWCADEWSVNKCLSQGSLPDVDKSHKTP